MRGWWRGNAGAFFANEPGSRSPNWSTCVRRLPTTTWAAVGAADNGRSWGQRDGLLKVDELRFKAIIMGMARAPSHFYLLWSVRPSVRWQMDAPGSNRWRADGNEKDSNGINNLTRPTKKARIFFKSEPKARHASACYWHFSRRIYYGKALQTTGCLILAEFAPNS